MSPSSPSEDENDPIQKQTVEIVNEVNKEKVNAIDIIGTQLKTSGLSSMKIDTIWNKRIENYVNH